MNVRLLCAFVLLGSVSGLCQQPFLDSHQWIGLRDEASGRTIRKSSLYHAAASLPIDLVNDYLNACSEAKLLSWR